MTSGYPDRGQTLLVVDDEPAVVALFRHIFAESGIDILAAGTASAAESMIRDQQADAIMLDVILPDGDGLDVFERIKRIDPHLPVIIMTVGRDSQTAIKAMQLGALDYLLKPLDVRSLNKVVRRALDVRRMMVEPVAMEADTESASVDSSMIGCCDAMQEVYKAIGRVASQNISVLIRGESGTGKELVARAIFQNGPRCDKPFLAINCAAIPEALLESELFGHEKGSFTGADRRRIGKIEQCHGGTLFLDEIGDMDPPLQSKLLRVLQEKQFERVGGSETLTADVRILAATHRNIEEMCQQGRFREDLFYRLNGYTIQLPPLRDRDGDIELLIDFFRRTANNELGKSITRVDPRAVQILKGYNWPGNVRQLQNVIHQAVLQSHGTALLPDFLPQLESVNHVPHDRFTDMADVVGEQPGDGDQPGEVSVPQVESVDQLIGRHRATASPTLYDDVIEEVERQLIADVLDDCGGNQTEAARRLGITRTTVRSKVNKLGIGIRKVVE